MKFWLRKLAQIILCLLISLLFLVLAGKAVGLAGSVEMVILLAMSAGVFVVAMRLTAGIARPK